MAGILFLTTGIGLADEERTAQERLQRAVEQAHQELGTERRRIRREDEAQARELQKALAESATLSDELVDRKLSIAKKAATLEGLRAERARLREQHDESQRDEEQIRNIASEAWQRLSDLIETLPPSEYRTRERELLSELETAVASSQGVPPDIGPLLKLLTLLLDESQSSGVFSGRIRTADGVEEEVDILRVGQVLFAYRESGSQRVGLAVSAPDGETGYRWSEELPDWARGQIRQAIERGGPDGAVYSLPIDVTQQMEADRSQGPDTAWQTIASGGPVMIPLGLVALAAIVLVAERFLYVLRAGRHAGKAGRAVLAACHAREYAQAEQAARQSPGLVSRVLAACLKHRVEDAVVMEDAIQEALLHEVPRLERGLPAIGILGSVAPLLGLLGTVTGMIATFDAIAAVGSSEPRLMAGGISEALMTTAAGLVIAIPVLLLHGYLSGRSERLIADTERYAATLLNLLRDQNHTDAKQTNDTDVERHASDC